MMLELAPVIGLLIVAAITPGPNNFFVMNAAMQGGIIAALRTIFAIIVGSLILFAVVYLGLDAIGQEVPLFRSVIGLFGSMYLGWLGASLMRSANENTVSATGKAKISDLGLVLFQFLNPKGWVLMSVFLATGGKGQAVTLVSILIVVISGCLAVWALAGLGLSRLYETPRGRLWIDRTMGLSLLIFFAVLAFQSLSHE